MAQKKTVKKGSATKKNTATKKNGEAKRNATPKKNNTTKKKVQNTKQTTAKSQGRATSKKTVSKKAQSVTKQKTSPGIIAIGVLLIAFGVVALGFMLRFAFMPAAKVNGQVITEAEVCQSIEDIKNTRNIQTDEEFASFMRSSNYTPETLRNTVLDSLIEDHIFNYLCEKYKVTVTQEEINYTYNQFLDEFNEQWGSQNVTFQQALAQQGFTVDSYKENIRVSLLSEKLVMGAADSGDCDDLAEKFFIEIGSKENINNIRGFYPIVFSSREEANVYKAKLDNKECELEDIINIVTSENEVNNINVDIEQFALSSVPEEYLTIINQLKIGESAVVGDVNDDTHFYLIYVNDVIQCNDPFISWDSLINTDIKHKLVLFYTSGNDSCLEDLINTEKENSVIEKYDMPWGLPYDVDINLGKV